MPKKNLRIYLLTYNVNGKDPVNVQGLFDFDHYDDVDIYAISLQELPYSTLFADYWRKLCENVLGRKGFILLGAESMTVTSLMVFVRKNKIFEYYNIDKSYANIDLLYRKGGVGVRFFWNNLTFCFVGSHFIPHDYNFEKRNDNYHYILNNLNFRPRDHILSHDFVFWLGDLNYRINTINTSEVKQFVDIALNDHKEDRFKNLLIYDQLAYARAYRKAFAEFNEAPINFAPTYKFVVNSQLYNDQRKPSYTDRILFRSAIERNSSAFIDLHTYSSLPSYIISDHKPVRLVANIAETAQALKIKSLQSSKIQSKRTRRSLHYPSVRISSFAADNENDLMDTQVEESRERHHADQPEEGLPESLQDQLFEESQQIPRRMLEVQNNEDELLDLLEPDEGTKMSRKLRIIFEPIHGWIENKPQSIRFRIKNCETNESVQPYPELFRSVLSEWDYIGLLREDWQEKDAYILFAYPDFNFIEEAREADVLESESEDSATTDSESVSYSTASLQNQPTTSSSSMPSRQDTQETIVQRTKRETKTKKSENDDNDVDDFVDAHEEYSYTANFGNDSTIISPGRYQLLYYRANGDVLGISDPFEIHRNPEMPEFPE